MKKETATTSATIFAWRPLAASCPFSLVSAVVIDLPMKIPDDAAGKREEADQRSAARGSADMESRALAEYARCIRPERLNLALPRNIPDAARCPAASTQERIQEKGPTEARPSLNRSGENEERRAVHIVRSMSQRGQMSLLRYARQKNFAICRKDRLQNYPPMGRDTCRTAATIGACNVYKNGYH
ncbi:hypothetical protein [Rhizobium laguerreae]|uniref:hypothetical protein n=1 Tax=Rhizobium laguerreae TaxID=1076926 RepID=UPI001C9297C5|nr:hypothetical protein [Rhizobium laguerreae]MBY3226934.1 hypothetical protein [Rhizobium laguerreae]MBY3343850.1 hypothetical protein [Rhizobium laguerreae]MBY3351164.1 hypothetical protein [Rhizobium laguerreae]MBY3371988.1 hypothetical protein [Rhizobium laguerreae]MBY3428440.1 hypothetical protein [Rhizobium laguerreae]